MKLTLVQLVVKVMEMALTMKLKPVQLLVKVI
jgi:hypothetical protein